MFNLLKSTRLFYILTAVFFLVPNFSVFASVATLTYDFTYDTASSAPAFITPITSGALITTEYSSTFASNVAKVTDYGSTGLGVYSLDDFPESDYQQVTWENGYTSNLFRQGFYLRATADASGVQTGYLFQVSPNLGHGRIFLISGGAITSTLASPTFSGQGNNTKRYYRATADGTTLTFERSANGSTWTNLATVTNSTYTSGGVYYGEGYGSGTGQSVAGNTYSDNIVYSYENTFDTGVTAPGAPLNLSATADGSVYSANLTWDSPTSNGGAGIYDYQVEYKLSADSSWTTFSDGVSKQRSATVTGLSGGETYDFRVKAINQGGTSSASDTDSVTFGILGTITLTSPTDHETFQRDGDDLADISITGTYTVGPPGTIEARFNGGAWTTISASPSGGTFSGTLSDQSVGQGTLEVRFSSNTAITDSASYVGIGDIYVVAGQSNASGRGDNNQSYSHATLRATLFGNDDVWKNLTDPYDRNGGQIDAVSSDSIAGGSFVPILADYILDNENIPVAFVPTAMGSTAMEDWEKGTGLYTSMARRIGEVGGSIKAVLWFQGESDSSAGAVVGYEDQLNGFVDDIAADFNGAKTVIGMLGSATSVGDGRSLVRMAQKAVINSNANAIQGPAMYDVNIDDGCDGTHFCSDGDLAIFGERWWLALDKEFYGGSDGFGPILMEDTSYYSVADNAVFLEFSDDSDPRITTPYISTNTVFTVLNGATNKTISSIDYEDDRLVKLNLGASVNTNNGITVSYADDNRSGILNAVYDSLGLPAMNFKDVTIEVGELPGVVSGMSSTPGQTSMDISWTAPSVVVPAVRDYEIQYKLSSDSSWTTLSDGTSTTTSASVTGLSQYTSYDFRVRASNNMGSGSYVELLSQYTDGNAPGVVTDLVSSGQTSTSISLSWTAPSVVVPAVSDYEIQYKLSSDLSWTTFSDGTSTTTSASVTGLSSNTSYDFRVRAVNAVGNGSYVELLNQSTDEDVPEVVTTGTISGSYRMNRVANTTTVPKIENNQQEEKNPCFTSGGLLRLGSRGNEVVILQKILTSKGLNVGLADGIFGRLTLGGVKKYQKDMNLLVDGLVGVQTKTSLGWCKI